MLVAYHPIYAHPLPEGHRFPMLKYELIPQQLLYQGIITPEQIHAPEPIGEEDILRAHDAAYWGRMKRLELTAREMRAIGFPLSEALVLRERVISQGAIDCAMHALQHGVALIVAGGTHHAFADRGEGFCLLNDFAIAACFLLHHGLASKILIIDLDVHQGNGTASIFRNEPRVFTFSMHGAGNYPFHKEQSDRDVPLSAGLGGDAYLALLDEHLKWLMHEVRPDFVCYLAGVDVLDTDKFGHLQLTLADCAERDRRVFRAAKAAGLPVIVAMGGGYSPDIRRIVDAHCATYAAAAEIMGG